MKKKDKVMLGFVYTAAKVGMAIRKAAIPLAVTFLVCQFICTEVATCL